MALTGMLWPRLQREPNQNHGVTSTESGDMCRTETQQPIQRYGRGIMRQKLLFWFTDYRTMSPKLVQ
jgi:hypothetical protein